MLKGIVGSLIDKMTVSAEIIDIRAWNNKGMYELDLHLPMIEMSKWQCVQRLKCKVGEMKYRDYTPALWDTKTHICTLYIDAKHDGVGSEYIRSLKASDFMLFAAAKSSQLPSQLGRILCLADASAFGHSLALKKMINKTDCPLNAVTFFEEETEIPQALKESNPEFEFLYGSLDTKIETLKEWCYSNDLSIYNSIYVTGGSQMVKEIKKTIKTLPNIKARLYTTGFWS